MEQKGKFDAQIEWCVEQRAHAIQMLENFEKGERHFRRTGSSPEDDVTQKHIHYYERIVEGMDKLIAAYEAHNT
jgi:hypothetical protein